MQKQNPGKSTRSRKSEDRDRIRLSRYAAIFGCVLMLMSGFFFAGRQHFASLDYGIKNSKLRKQLEDLKAEKQRLLFAREVSLSPNEIKRSAKKAGLIDGRSETAMTPRLASSEPARKAPASIEKASAVVKTGSVQPVSPRAEKAVQPSGQAAKPVKAAVVTE